MCTNPLSLGHEPGPAVPIPSSSGSRFQWPVAVLCGLAAAHIVAGVIELSLVAGNFLLQTGYTGGPMGLLGALTVHLAGFLNSLLLVSPSNPTLFWSKSEWMLRSALSSHDFFVAMVAADLVVAMLNLALGQGLWRRRPWARQLEIALMSLAGLVAAAHGFALLWVGRPWKDLGMFVLLMPLLVVVPILSFLTLPETAALFVDSTPDVLPARRNRAWWMLPLQFLLGLLALALAVGILLVVSLGPMVEVAWVAMHVVFEVPWF